jgi:hypothetical protein
MKTYQIKGRVWRWPTISAGKPGVGGWCFVSIDKKLTEELKKTGKKYIYGSGFIGIQAKIGKTEWDTALFPYSKERIYLLSIKGAIRKKEEILEGDTVLASFTFRK